MDGLPNVPIGRYVCPRITVQRWKKGRKEQCPTNLVPVDALEVLGLDAGRLSSLVKDDPHHKLGELEDGSPLALVLPPDDLDGNEKAEIGWQVEIGCHRIHLTNPPLGFGVSVRVVGIVDPGQRLEELGPWLGPGFDATEPLGHGEAPRSGHGFLLTKKVGGEGVCNPPAQWALLAGHSALFGTDHGGSQALRAEFVRQGRFLERQAEGEEEAAEQNLLGTLAAAGLVDASRPIAMPAQEDALQFVEAFEEGRDGTPSTPTVDRRFVDKVPDLRKGGRSHQLLEEVVREQAQDVDRLDGRKDLGVPRIELLDLHDVEMAGLADSVLAEVSILGPEAGQHVGQGQVVEGHSQHFRRDIVQRTEGRRRWRLQRQRRRRRWRLDDRGGGVHAAAHGMVVFAFNKSEALASASASKCWNMNSHDCSLRSNVQNGRATQEMFP